MLIIKELAEHIREELEDVKKYAEAAMRARMDDPPLASVYADLGQEEMKHAERLHKVAVDLIDREKTKGTEIPPVMRALWDYEHKVMVEEMAKAKHMLELIR